jgi:hypothetical protein
MQRELVAGGVPVPFAREVRLRAQRAVVPRERHEQGEPLNLPRQRMYGHERIRRLEVRAGRVDDRVARALRRAAPDDGGERQRESDRACQPGAKPRRQR